jgi:hypothetical protein
MGTLICILLLSGMPFVQSAFAWETILNNPDGADILRAVTTDSADNIIGAGLVTRATGDRTFVVVKFSRADGSVKWFVEIDGTIEGDDEAFGVTVDSNDDVLAVGRLRNHDVPQDSPFDLVVVKLASSTGMELWRREINGTADNDDVARSVAVDSNDDVVVAGKITDAVTSGNFAVIKFSGTDGTIQWTWTTTETGDAHTVSVNSQNEVIAGGSTNVGFTVVKIDPDGRLVWRQEIPRLACCLDTVFSLALDSHDDVLAAGQRQQNFAAVKMAGDTGAVIWSRQISGTGSSGEQASRVAVDPNDDVVVAGFINNGATGFDWDFTVIKFAGLTGVTRWAQLIDGGTFGAFDEARDLVIDGFGDIYVTGDIGTDAFGTQDLAVVKLAGGDGTERWRHTAPLPSRGNAIAIDSRGDITVAGEFLEFVNDPDSGVIKLDGTTGIHFPVTILVSIDIRPKSDANKIDPDSKGKIAVAIVSANGFDADNVDLNTVRFGATGTEASPIVIAKRDFDRDKDRDLVLRFEIRETGIECGDTSAFLTGQALDGIPILGSSPIQTVNCKKHKGRGPHF